MTFSDDFVPVEDAALEGPSYPVVFGVELTPKVQGIAIAVLGVVGAGVLFVRLVQPVQLTKTEIELRIEGKEATLAAQEASLQQVEAVREELDNVLALRAGIYSLLGDPNSLDTLLLDINQQIESSNASIQQVIAGDLARDAATLAPLGFTPVQIERLITDFANNPVLQKQLYTSELFTYNPVGLPAPIDDAYGPALNGKLERQIVEVQFQALFNQTQNILYNLERLEPLLIIRNFGQSLAPPPQDVTEEDLNAAGITRLLDTSFTMEVLVPIGDPLEPPVPPAPEEPPAEGEGAEGEAPPEGEAAPEG